MDPLAAPLVLATVKNVLNTASGAAGNQLWEGFVALARRALGRHDAPLDSTQLDPAQFDPAQFDPAQAEPLAVAVTDAANRDPDLAAALRDWLAQAGRLAVHDESVTNVISDSARISGNVVQARDISGPITFH
jgi:hypothetical protein